MNGFQYWSGQYFPTQGGTNTMANPFLAPALIAGGTELLSGLLPGPEEQPLQQYSVKRLLQAFAKGYPGFKMPEIGPETIALVSRMMAGQLPEGVEQAYGAGAEREYGGMLSSLADIGAGPATQALARRGVMQGLGERIAQARMGAVQTGLGAAPGAFQMAMTPYQADVGKWQNILGAYQAFPSGAFLEEGQGIPGIWSPKKKKTAQQVALQNRMQAGYGYNPYAGVPGYGYGTVSPYRAPATTVGYSGRTF